ncbi:cytochrome P450 315a1, mitochondrial [Microplitis mediator]|uniref:cytochrome P450 315a1, mitochondrial n=1 Tax=Microplitis mediator TaxID=375433 RepID=UPI0025531FCD|nr:cytochrome P450 315a1, mitochondrial [Microplitis mediator]
MFLNKNNNNKLLAQLFNNAVVKKKNNSNSNNNNIISDKYLNTKPIPECPRPGIFESIKSLVNYDKAMKLHEIVDNKHRELGPIYKDHIGPVTAFFLNSPEDYRKIFKNEGPMPMHFLPEAWLIYNNFRKCSRGLLFMNGEEWLNFRRIINKLLLQPYDAKSIVINSCQDAAVTLTEECKKLKNGCVIPELETRLYKWSIEVMMASLLGSAWNKYRDTIADGESDKLAENLHKIFELTARLSLLPVKYVVKFNLPVWRRFVQVVDEVLELVGTLVPKMIKYQGDGLLSLMLNEGMSEQDVTRIVTDLILAAGDTTAFSTQWALFLLGSNEDVQNKFAEISSNLELEETIKNPYIKGIIKESLRLYPTAPFLTRILPDDCLVSGHLVPRGELIIMSLYSSGRDPNNFSRPNEFLPERWIRNTKGSYDDLLNPFATIPFALGVRSCVGRKIAETQMIMTLSELVKNFKINCLNKENIKLKLHMISVPSEPIKLQLTQRIRV